MSFTCAHVHYDDVMCNGDDSDADVELHVAKMSMKERTGLFRAERASNRSSSTNACVRYDDVM